MDVNAPYDALLLLSFGGPEAPQEVMPFLRRVTAGRGIPDERLEQVAEHYQHFGGRSPINDQNRALIVALRAELDARGIDLPIIWGNRNSAPFVLDALREADEAGWHRLVTVTTSAYSCYSSCRQYREDLAAAVAQAEDEGRMLQVDKVGQYVGHAGFTRANTRLVRTAVKGLVGAHAALEDRQVRMLFVTHSIPTAMDETSGPGDGEGELYRRQHETLAGHIAQSVNTDLSRAIEHEVVYCSRSGAPSTPWLEPDVNDRIRELAKDGVTEVVLAPIGFVSDHMEVVFDLDTEATQTADEVGVRVVRVPTVGIDAEFVKGLVDAVLQRAQEARGEPGAVPTDIPELVRPSTCLPGCCPNLRVAKPALCGSD